MNVPLKPPLPFYTIITLLKDTRKTILLKKEMRAVGKTPRAIRIGKNRKKSPSRIGNLDRLEVLDTALTYSMVF